MANATTNTPTVNGDLDATDVDNDLDGWKAVTVGATQYGSYSITDRGQWTYTVNNSNAAVQALNVGTTLTDTFTAETTDGTTQVVRITINGANDNPVVGAAVTLAAATEDATRTITKAQLLANTTDVDNPNLVVTDLQISSGNGTLTDNGNRTWSYNPAPNDDTSVSFTYKVGDGIAAAIATSATMDITPVNGRACRDGSGQDR